MAAILQLRQGSTSTYISQGPNTGEPFFDTGSNILIVGKSSTEVIKLTKLDESNAGSFEISGNYTGSNLYLSNDLTASNALLSGDITIGGNIILGDAVQDNITISGQFDSDLIPSASGEYDLGSTTKKWNNLYAVSASIDSIDLTSSLPSGVISGSEQINADSIVNFDTNVDTRLDAKTVISGSQQVIDLLPSGVISGSSQLPSGIISGSSQVVESLPTGTISGSDQVLGGTSIVSSSVQVISFLPSGTVSGSSQVIDVLTQVNSFTSSQESKNTTLATYTGSVDTSISSLNSFTNSFDTAISLDSTDVTILGNLTVQGTQTQLNTSTLNVEDKNILLASGAADSSAANGAGITIDGADKSLQWEHSTTQFVFDAQVSSSVGFKGDGSNLTGLTADSVEFTDILNKPTLISGSDQVLGGTNIVSSSTQVVNFLPDGVVSGSTQILGGTNIVSSSDQVTSSLDLRYTSVGGSNILSSSNETFEEYSSSVDTRLLDTLSSGSDTSQSLHTLVGAFPTSGSLGTSAFYNVSSSLADDPNVIPNVKAVYDYINNTIGAADITGVSASLGLSGGGSAGYVSLSLDTGSTHFQQGVELYSSTLPDGVVSGSSQITDGSGIVSGSVVSSLPSGTVSGSSQITDGSGILSGSITSQLPSGVISGSTQTITHINSTQLVGVNTTSPNNLGYGQLNINDDDTTGTSGVLVLEDSGTVKSYDYVSSNIRYVDTNSGVSIALKPDSDGAKSWVIDTDGDLVSNGGSWQSGSAFMNHLIASSSVTSSNILATGNVTISGNLTVSGTTTSVNSNTVNIGDNMIVLNSDETGTPSQDAGIEIERGTSTNVKFQFKESTDRWQFTNDGTTFFNLPTSTADVAEFSNLYYTDARVKTKLDAETVISGSTFVSNEQGTFTASVNDTNTNIDLGLGITDDVVFNTVNIDSTTDSTSITTGALVVDGGVGVSGSVNVGGDVVAYASSDKRLKDEIIPISNPLDKINSIGGYSFVWNNEKQNIYNGKDYGVIAQEIEEILPELVQNRENGYKAVKYDKLVSLLIEGIKELSKEVQELKKKIN